MEGGLEYVDRAPGLDSHVFVRNADMLAHCERHENAVQASEAAVRRWAAGGRFFCLHQHYVHRKYYRNRPHEHREWNPGQASLKSGKRADRESGYVGNFPVDGGGRSHI